MGPNIRWRLLIVLFSLVAWKTAAQSSSSWGRITLFGTMQQSQFDDGTTRDYSELWTSIALRSPVDEENGGLEYGLDVRSTTYPSSTDQDQRTNIYDAWIGARSSNGLSLVRVGQMWIDDLGSLGSVGGAMAQFTLPRTTSLGRLRFGLFGGLEPEILNAGYVPNVRKAGAWLALDGRSNRRHVLGYVQIRDAELVERSVVTMTNFIPAAGKLFLYQTAELDLTGPGGLGEGGLNYFFTNVRYLPSRRVELMGNYHRGISIDARTITQDILNGRPVDQNAIDGFLYESVGGRVTVEVIRGVRLYAGYWQDQSDRDDSPADRISAGIWGTNFLKSGIDLTISDNRIDREEGGYDSWFVSVGRNVGSSFYASLDYSTSLSIIRLDEGGGVTVETRPRTKRYSLNGSWNVHRRWSILMTLDQLNDDTATEYRGTTGLSIRL